MATRITYHQYEVTPHDGSDTSVLLPGVEPALVSIVGAEFIGGGGDKRFLLHVVTLEAADEPQNNSPRSS